MPKWEPKVAGDQVYKHIIDEAEQNKVWMENMALLEKCEQVEKTDQEGKVYLHPDEASDATFGSHFGNKRPPPPPADDSSVDSMSMSTGTATAASGSGGGPQ